jgi:hypothetical protein
MENLQVYRGKSKLTCIGEAFTANVVQILPLLARYTNSYSCTIFNCKQEALMNVADARRIFKHRLSKACLLLLILSVPASADWRPSVPEARLVGRGDFTWFGMSLYTARLWSSEAPPAWISPLRSN